jgi:hypothetical protein
MSDQYYKEHNHHHYRECVYAYKTGNLSRIDILEKDKSEHDPHTACKYLNYASRSNNIIILNRLISITHTKSSNFGLLYERATRFDHTDIIEYLNNDVHLHPDLHQIQDYDFDILEGICSTGNYETFCKWATRIDYTNHLEAYILSYFSKSIGRGGSILIYDKITNDLKNEGLKLEDIHELLEKALRYNHLPLINHVNCLHEIDDDDHVYTLYTAASKSSDPITLLNKLYDTLPTSLFTEDILHQYIRETYNKGHITASNWFQYQLDCLEREYPSRRD